MSLPMKERRKDARIAVSLEMRDRGINPAEVSGREAFRTAERMALRDRAGEVFDWYRAVDKAEAERFIAEWDWEAERAQRCAAQLRPAVPITREDAPGAMKLLGHGGWVEKAGEAVRKMLGWSGA